VRGVILVPSPRGRVRERGKMRKLYKNLPALRATSLTKGGF